MNCDRASDDFYKYDFEFHRAIADGTGNFYVKQIYTMLMESLLAVISLIAVASFATGAAAEQGYTTPPQIFACLLYTSK